jgi:hypothetical protein
MPDALYDSESSGRKTPTQPPIGRAGPDLAGSRKSVVFEGRTVCSVYFEPEDENLIDRGELLYKIKVVSDSSHKLDLSIETGQTEEACRSFSLKPSTKVEFGFDIPAEQQDWIADFARTILSKMSQKDAGEVFLHSEGSNGMTFEFCDARLDAESEVSEDQKHVWLEVWAYHRDSTDDDDDDDDDEE